MRSLKLGDTPIFVLLTLEYPDLVWTQPFEAVQTWGGRVLRLIPTGPLTTL